MPAVARLAEVPGKRPLSSSGRFVVRTLVMDLSQDPALRDAYQWPNNVQVVTSLTDADAPVPTHTMPDLLYGLGTVETREMGSNGITTRTVIFSSTRHFRTVEDARRYVTSTEHEQIQQMIASFRG